MVRLAKTSGGVIDLYKTSFRTKVERIIAPVVSRAPLGFASGMTVESIADIDNGFDEWRGWPIEFAASFQQFNGGASGAASDATPFGRDNDILLDIASGGPIPENETPGDPATIAAAAAGAFDDAWRGWLISLRHARMRADGTVAPTIVRPFHEMTGGWYGWSVKWYNLEDWQSMARRWRGILDEVFPECLFAFCPNPLNFSHVSVSKLYQSGVWDVLSLDPYNQNPSIGTNLNNEFVDWDIAAIETRSLRGDPRGLEAWRQWAEDRSLAIYFPEYGNYAAENDDPSGYWMTKILDWCKNNAGYGPGQIFAEAINNTTGRDRLRVLWDPLDGPIYLPNTATAYRSWFAANTPQE